MMAMKNLNLADVPDPGSRYLLEDCLGSGAFGRVFCATDTQASDKKVAIKIQNLDQDTQPYIEQEYRVLRDLSDYSNLADFYGIYRKDHCMWFVMELLDGGSVIDLVKGLSAQNRRMGEEHIAYIVKETVKAAVFLHENCTVHRNIKAKNVMLTKNGEVKLVDFGFSCTLPEQLGQTDGCLGSPCWMAPEVITSSKNRRNYGNRADVWSLGITAIEIGDGQAPYESMHPTRALFQIVTNPPPMLRRPSNWSQTYVDFVAECLEKNPEHRPFMAELVDHPFLDQIPQNNYHLTLEIKSLVENVDRFDLADAKPETAVAENVFRKGVDGCWEHMYVEDLAALEKISENNVLKLLEERMKVEQFQTFAGDVLLVLKPNERIDIFGTPYHEKYRLKSRSDNAPHVFSIADSAYQNALHHRIPQRIVLSGESGSGKTTNYLHLVEHLLYLGQNTNINLERLKNAIKLIHSLTHASTPTNNYSTRCVFKTDIKYGSTGKVSGAVFNVYQLEKWRVSSVDMFQGNFHFLYYIYDGLRENNKLEQYYLNSDRQYRYLRVDAKQNPTNSPKFNISSNLIKFKKILNAFEEFELTDEALDTIFCLVAAILNIGEIRFRESNTHEAVIDTCDYINRVAELLKVDASKLEWSFINYCVILNGAAVRRRSTVDEARDARDVFANNLYARLVDFVVEWINQKLGVGRAIFGEQYSIQILDYFGFECFARNHLPQLIVNCFNEQLHYHYLQRMFSWECLEANEEGIEYQPFGYYDNKKTLDQLLSQSCGIFSAIDEASKMSHESKYIINQIQNQEQEFVCVSSHSEFSVAHYTGRVVYDATEMPDKNRDFLPPEIIETLRLSDCPTVKMLFTNKLNKTGNLIVPFDKTCELNTKRYRYQHDKTQTHQYSQIKRARTSIHTFKALSLELLKELAIGSGSGATHFVRCLRTDLKNEGFNYQLVKQQVRALAITETAKARQRGYPHRIPFAEFLRRYQFLAFDFNENVEVNSDNCRLLLIRLKMEGWSIGKSKVFLKYHNEEYLSRLYEGQVKKIIKIQSILRRFLAKCLVTKQMKTEDRHYISTIGKPESHKMTQEEAAAIIQRAYRESTIRKSYPDFAKDYKILDEDTCDFIRSFATRWKQNSLFHVLVLYRARRLQDMFNFSQQVHFYNIGVFYELQQVNQEISCESIDVKAQVSNWLVEVNLPVRKIPFRLDEIPFCDPSSHCNQLINPGVSAEKDDSWDLPYRWRELVSSKSSEPEETIRSNEDLINLPYVRDPESPIVEIPDLVDNKEVVSKEDKNQKNEKTQIISKETKNEENEEPDNNNKINSNTKPANEDFDYIKAPKINRPKSVDPIAEMRQISQKNSSEDEPPFNFKGMLRKTNFKRQSIKKSDDSEVPVYCLKKKYNQVNGLGEENDKDVNKNENDYNMINNRRGEEIEKKVRLELFPGIVIEGIEVEL